MKGKFIRTTNAPVKAKIFRKTIPALTVIMMALAMGIEVNETEALAFTNTTKEISIGIEVDTPVKPDVEKVVANALAEKSTKGFWDWVEDSGSASNDGSSDGGSSDGGSSEETSSPEDTSSPTETPTSTPVATTTETPTATPVVTPTPTYKPSDLDVVTKDELETGEYRRSCSQINTTDPENRFNWLNDENKELIKSYYSSKYWDTKLNGGQRYIGLNMSDYHGNVYRLYNLIPMRKAIEEHFGISNIYSAYDEPDHMGNHYVKAQGSPLSYVLSQNARMEKALKNTEDRKFLTDLAVQYNITTASDTSAPEAVLAVYYGIVNNDLSNTNFKYNANKKITREEFAILMTKFTGGWKTLDYANGMTMGATKKEFGAKDWKFMSQYKNCKTFNYMTYASGLDNPINPLQVAVVGRENKYTLKYKFTVTKKRMQSSISKIEVLRMIASAYASQSTTCEDSKGKYIEDAAYNYDVSNYVKVTDKELIKVIKKYHLSSNPTKYLKAAKKLDGSGDRTITRKDDEDYLILTKSKQLSIASLKALAKCDKLGIIKPNSAGKINLYATVTEKEALKLLTKGAMNCRTYYDTYSHECGF